MSELNDDELLAALGIEIESTKTEKHTPKEERIIAGFEEIVQFYQTYKRIPQNDETRDIFERLYAVRLDQIRKIPEAKTLLAELDSVGLLADSNINTSSNNIDDETLLSALGLDTTVIDENDITILKHVRTSTERSLAEEYADRKVCKDFELFQPLFEEVERELKSNIRTTLRFKKDASVEKGNFFIVGGLLAYVAEIGETKLTSDGRNDGRLRLIYANRTESNLLLRSLQKALYKDQGGRRVTDPNIGPLFGDSPEADDIETGTIYVLRSQSNHPFVAEHRALIHKIGVTGGKVENRIANAPLDPTYLLADVEVIASYTLHNIHRTKLENLFHRLFASAKLDITIEDRFGNPVKPREWFLLPLHVIDQAVQHIRDGTITDLWYNPETASLESVSSN